MYVSPIVLIYPSSHLSFWLAIRLLSRNITFICTGKLKNSYYSLYCDTCFIVVVWNWTSVSSRYACMFPLDWPRADISWGREEEAEGRITEPSGCCGHRTHWAGSTHGVESMAPWAQPTLWGQGQCPAWSSQREGCGMAMRRSAQKQRGTVGSWSKVPVFFPPVLLSQTLKIQRRVKQSLTV